MPLSEDAKRAAFDQESEEAWIVLLAITHPELAVSGQTLRVCDQGTAVDELGREYVDHDGERYYAAGFDFELPADREGETPKAKIRIDNVGTVTVDGQEIRILQEIRKLTTAPALACRIVLASDPDIVEYELHELTLVDVRGNAATIEGVLGYEDTFNQAFPAITYSPATAPGMFP
jgi:hypothetical protein